MSTGSEKVKVRATALGSKLTSVISTVGTEEEYWVCLINSIVFMLVNLAKVAQKNISILR